MGWFYRSVSEVFFHPEQIYPTLWDRETDHHVFTGYLAQFSRRETRHENIGPQFYLLIKIKNRVRACGCWNEDVTLSSKQKRILIRRIQVQWCWILFTVGTCMFFFLFFFLWMKSDITLLPVMHITALSWRGSSLFLGGLTRNLISSI